MNEDINIPLFQLGPIVIMMLGGVLISVIIATLKWPAIAPAIMFLGIQVLGMIIGSMGMYISHSIIYFASFLAFLALLSNMVFSNGKPLGFDTPSIMLIMITFFLLFGLIKAPGVVRELSWKKIQLFGSLGILPFMLGRTFARGNDAAWKPVSYAAWFSVLYTPFVAAMVLVGGYKTLGAGRFSAMGGPIGAGKIFGMATIFMVAAIWQEGMRGWKRLFMIIGAVSALIVTFSTYSRGPFLALLIGMMAMFLVMRKLSTKIIVCIIVPIALIFFLALLAPEAAWERIVGRTLGGEGIGSLSTGRIDLYINTLKKVPEAPVLGHGTASFGFIIFSTVTTIVYPHNIFLEFLFENGLIGLLLFLIFLYSVLRNMARFLKNSSLSKSLRRAYIGLFVHSMVIVQFSQHFAAQPMFWFTCGIVSGNLLHSPNESLEPVCEEPFVVQEQELFDYHVRF